MTPKQGKNTKGDRIPRHSSGFVPNTMALERSILGAMLLQPNLLADTTSLDATDFTVSAHRITFGRMRDLAAIGCPIDLTTLCHELERHGELETVGHVAFIGSLLDGVPDRPSIQHYVCALREAHHLRTIQELGEKIPELVSQGMTVEAVVARVDSALAPSRLFVNAQKDREVQLIASKDADYIDGANLLDRICNFIGRFVMLTNSQLRLIALWIVHSHGFEAADVTPYLAITSAEKRCGKTRLLEILFLLVRHPWLTGRTTAAALFRKIDAQKPTVLLDEGDAAFNGNREYAEALRGILNTGYRRGGAYSICVGKSADIQLRDFQTFSPKAIAGIGNLPDTVSDRSIPIRLKRKTAGEAGIERFRERLLGPDAAKLRAEITAWVQPRLDTLRGSRPLFPECLTDRQEDCVEPLLAIADTVGGEWPNVARQAIVEIFAGRLQQDQSIGVRLLADIKAVYDECSAERLSSQRLLDLLTEIETSLWADFENGRPMTVGTLSRLLRPFEISPRTIRLGQGTIKGYLRSTFEDAWSRYLPPSQRESGSTTTSDPSQASQAAAHLVKLQLSVASQGLLVTALKAQEWSVIPEHVTGVTPRAPETQLEQESQLLEGEL